MPAARKVRVRRGLAVAPAVVAIALVLPLTLAATPTPAHATRPFRVTESAVALPPGGVRVEEGLSRARWDGGLKLYSLETEVSYSLYANLDLEVEAPWVVAGGGGAGLEDGLGDVVTKAKINFVKERAAIPLTLSGLVGVKFPTGPSTVSTDQADVQLAALASKVIGPAQVHGNLSYTFVGDSSTYPANNVLGLSVGVAVDTPVEFLTGVAELIWEENRVRGTDDRTELAGGAVYRLGPRVALDALLSFGLNSGRGPQAGAADTTVAFGLTWDAGRL
jgi:Putative MetA-pathway of phenol degradation